MPNAAGTLPPWWCKRLKGQGLRLTIPRQEILRVLHRMGRHLSAEDVYIEVHKIYPEAGLTTVYRTLDLLDKINIIHKFDFGDGKTRYELSEGHKTEEHHHHLICKTCKKAINYKGFESEEKELLKRIGKEVSTKYGFNVKESRVQLLGICKKCRKKEKKI